MPAIELQELSKRFGDVPAVRGVSFSVEEGEIFGLLGPNGAGKSTLVRMLSTLMPPSSGTARIGGFDLTRRADAVRRIIGVVPQTLTSDLQLSAEENLLIFAKLYNVPRDRRTRAIRDLLEAVELTAWAGTPVKYLSGGMRRRVEIARGLVHEPSILFLDEPTTGLDPVSRVVVWEMLRRLGSERRLTVLMTTHYMDEADKMCDRIAILDRGAIVALDSPIALKASVAGSNAIEVGFEHAPRWWPERIRALAAVERVTQNGAAFRIVSSNGPRTTMALAEAVSEARVTITSLSVISTTLDDVFAYYTGRHLRDSLQDASLGERGSTAWTVAAS
jgi:ABC-2 type transport system ATP-binding protein